MCLTYIYGVCECIKISFIWNIHKLFCTILILQWCECMAGFVEISNVLAVVAERIELRIVCSECRAAESHS